MTTKLMPPELKAGDFFGSIANSPYKLSDDDLKYNRVFFGFLDILGYRSFLLNKDENAPREIYKLLKNTFEHHSSTYESVKIKLLSDSILIWTDGDLAIHFWNLVNVVELIREEFLKRTLLLRGGISIGKNFIEQDIIVSPALVEAYELERKAVTPRIIVSETAQKQGLQGLVQNQTGAIGFQIGGYFRIVNINKIEKDDDSNLILTPFNETNSLCFLRTGLPLFYCAGDASPTSEQKNTWNQEGISDLDKLRNQVIATKPAESAKAEIKNKYKYLVKKYNTWIKRYSHYANEKEIIYTD